MLCGDSFHYWCIWRTLRVFICAGVIINGNEIETNYSVLVGVENTRRMELGKGSFALLALSPCWTRARRRPSGIIAKKGCFLVLVSRQLGKALQVYCQPTWSWLLLPPTHPRSYINPIQYLLEGDVLFWRQGTYGEWSLTKLATNFQFAFFLLVRLWILNIGLRWLLCVARFFCSRYMGNDEYWCLIIITSLIRVNALLCIIA